MQNVFIESELANLGLQNTHLSFLHPDDALYSVLMLQPEEDIDATDEGLRVYNRDSAIAKFNSFIDLAFNQDPDLVLTPEYSCPWETIEELITKERFPGEGKLWAIGCESIKPTELAEFTKKLNSVSWIYEDNFKGSTGNFLDPMCYFFRAKDKDDLNHVVIVIQFKGQPMAEHSHHLERDNLILGQRRYIFRNDGNSVYLTSIICSDALNFSISSLDQHFHVPYIILHPQLNYDPRHPAFKLYRDKAFLQNWDRQEFICVNWARGFHLPEYPEFPASDFGGSAFYTKSGKLLLTDERVTENHRLGMYYANYRLYYTNVYFFNYCEHGFLFRTTKPSQAAAMGVAESRTGPEMIKIFCWEAGEKKWNENDSCNDGFNELCAEMDANVWPLSDSNLHSLNKERLLALSTGELRNLGKHNKWHDVQYLPAFNLDNNEVICRVTFTHDPSPESCMKRSNILNRYSRLKNHILTNPENFPSNISDLAHNCKVEYPHPVSGYNCNLSDKSGKLCATGAYVGECSSPVANRIYDKMDSLLEEHEKRRLAVWYQNGNDIQCLARTDKPQINDDLSESRRSITKEETQ